MNKFILFLAFPFFLSAQTNSKKLRVLFIGNSYTYVNNLPQLVRDIALSKGDTLVFDSYAPGGYTFYNHFNDANTQAKISQANWDYVILQAQSQEPSFPPAQVSSQTLPYAIKLDSVIKHYNPCAHTMFYETWGRKFGDQSNCPGYPPLCTYTGMQNRLRDTYKMFADTVHDLMAPVGEAWRLAIATNTAIDLYQVDQSHPSLEGSYLTGAVFYECLFQKSVSSSTYTPGIATATVSFLQQVAHQLATDSIAITNIPLYISKASFSINPLSSAAFQFQSGTPALTHHWYFGDGSSSFSASPNHTYASSGTYTVSLTIYNTQNCKQDSITKTVQASVVLTGIKEYTKESVLVHPNPCSSYVFIEAGKGFENSGSVIEVRNLLNQVVHTSAFTGQLNTSSFENGIYYFKVYNQQAQSNSCFIKNE